MWFIEDNYRLIYFGLVSIYSNEYLKQERSKYYLTRRQLRGILDYLCECGEDFGTLDIANIIDSIINNGYGFNEDGEPIELQEA